MKTIAILWFPDTATVVVDVSGDNKLAVVLIITT